MPRPGETRSPAARVLAPWVEQVAGFATTREGTGLTEPPNRAASTAGGLMPVGHLNATTDRERPQQAVDQARSRQATRNGRSIDDGLTAGVARSSHLEGRS